MTVSAAPLSPREILEALIAFPSVSHESNLPLIDWVANYLESQGITSVKLPSPSEPKAHLYAQVGPDLPGGIILSGHSDVVPVEGQAWSSDPWKLTERDGRFYGRGTCDMKGFVAQAIAALVRAKRQDLAHPLQLALSYDEELGCMAVADLADAMAANLPRAQSVLVGEPTMFKVVTGHKGGLGFRVRVTGYEVHSSIPHKGVSAIMEGVRLIQWANAQNEAGASATPAPLAAPFDPPWTTAHVGMISGGTAHNITARTCDFVLTFRTVPGERDWEPRLRAEVARIEAAMKAVRPEAGITLEKIFDMPGLAPEPEGPAEALARRTSGDNSLNVVSYGTEGGQFQARGYSTVVCGPGDIDRAHKADEYLTLAEFDACEAWLDQVIDQLRG